MANAADLKSAIAKATYGFESHPRHTGIIDDSADHGRGEGCGCRPAWASSGPLARCYAPSARVSEPASAAGEVTVNGFGPGRPIPSASRWSASWILWSAPRCP